MNLGQGRDQWKTSMNITTNLQSIKGREYLEEVKDYQCLKKDSTLVH
jgi:hypothetical protein